MLRKYTQINWSRGILMLIPPLLRKSKQVVWLNVLLTPLKNVYDDTLYKMQHNGQVVYLEKVLNELFNPGRKYRPDRFATNKANAGLIFIEDAHRPEVQYLYTHKEIEEEKYEPIDVYTHDGETRELFTFFLYLSGDLDFQSTQYFNFRINIPSNLLLPKDTYDTVLTCIKNELESDNITEYEYLDQIEELSNMLVAAGKHPFSNHPKAVKIQTPKFHKVVNYYKLAAKSYETRQYEFNDNPPLDKLREGKRSSKLLKI